MGDCSYGKKKKVKCCATGAKRVRRTSHREEERSGLHADYKERGREARGRASMIFNDSNESKATLDKAL
jgi:hypothetical protein